ncbi:MAG: NADP-dependent malic enzyme [Gammaproteobacteria bacterium]|nr:NADP-dependent malic enzyme [Gammaproteobacteria bacterium]
MTNNLEQEALEYHRLPIPGKIEVVPTKPLANQHDLALAYTPGVAAACEAIVNDPVAAFAVTARSNLVAVITNGTAVLGMGSIGPLAAKPVMEGKGVLFKKFAGIDVFDIEINEADPVKLVEIIASLEPTFGGINLEDIKSPECFQIEGKLRRRLKIPVFHDDQHGTAIIVAAAILNGLRLVGKQLDQVQLVTAGAGASALACLNLLAEMGMPKENITATDRSGVIYRGRGGSMEPHKRRFARDTNDRTLADAIKGADIFLGLSGPGVLKQEMVRSMAEKPLILALANPIPEILPEEVRAVRPDAVIGTGRSDYPNQVNNVLCFPYIFRGALDVGATTITGEMKIACVYALAELAMEVAPDIVVAAYGGTELKFGPDYLIPKPFDPRLILKLAPAVAKAAMESGVASRPIEDLNAYCQQLTRYVFDTVLFMQPVFDRAKRGPKRLVYADGEESNVLRAVQAVVDEGLAQPILIGRADVVARQIEESRLRIRPGTDFELVDPKSDPRSSDYCALYHEIKKDEGLALEDARAVIHEQNTVIAALMMKRGEADAMICGLKGDYGDHLRHIVDVLGVREGIDYPAAMNIVILKKGTYFICDTDITPDPTAKQVVEMTLLAAEAVRRLGITPKVALLSHSNNSSADTPTARKMREALQLIKQQAPDLEVEGEMRADAALLEDVRRASFPDSKFWGEANVLIMPTLDAANIAHDLVRVLAGGVSIGPILLGIAQPAHILAPSATVRRIVNMTALAVVETQMDVTTRDRMDNDTGKLLTARTTPRAAGPIESRDANLRV